MVLIVTEKYLPMVLEVLVVVEQEELQEQVQQELHTQVLVVVEETTQTLEVMVVLE